MASRCCRVSWSMSTSAGKNRIRNNITFRREKYILPARKIYISNLFLLLYFVLIKKTYFNYTTSHRKYMSYILHISWIHIFFLRVISVSNRFCIQSYHVQSYSVQKLGTSQSMFNAEYWNVCKHELPCCQVCFGIEQPSNDGL